MKIKKWEDLDGVSNDYLTLEIGGCGIYVSASNDMNNEIASIDRKNVKAEIIIKILSAFGFDIEFEEQPKLTDNEWHFVRAFDSGWIARDNDERLYYYKTKPIKRECFDLWAKHTDEEEDYRVQYSLFKFIKWTDTEPWSIADLRKLEKEV